MKKRRKTVTKIVVCFALMLLFVYLFYIRYLKWSNCFNELGRCYDPDGSKQVYTTAGELWIVPAMIFFLLGIIHCIVLLREAKRK